MRKSYINSFFFLQKTTTVQRITCVLILLIKWEFEYALCAFQDELVDHLLFIKDKIFLKHFCYNVEITGTIIIVIMF